MTRSDLAPSVEVTGTITADDKVAIASKVSGRVEHVAAREGEPVRAGQVVVRLDDRDIAAQVEQARAALEMARVRLTQAETMAQLQTTRSGADVEQAKAALAGAQAELAALRSGARPQERKQAEYAAAQAKAARPYRIIQTRSMPVPRLPTRSRKPGMSLWRSTTSSAAG